MCDKQKTWTHPSGQTRISPKITNQAAFLGQVQEVDEENHPLLRLFPRQPVDATKKGERVADGELVVKRQVLPGGEKQGLYFGQLD